MHGERGRFGEQVQRKLTGSFSSTGGSESTPMRAIATDGKDTQPKHSGRGRRATVAFTAAALMLGGATACARGETPPKHEVQIARQTGQQMGHDVRHSKSRFEQDFNKLKKGIERLLP